MADIFISYAREDRSKIAPIVEALEKHGWSVFWDRTIPAGKTWRQVIGDALETARSVIVAWSKTSVNSTWVQEEADRGLERRILIPILIDNVRPPLGFGGIQAADLINWDTTQSSSEFEKLISDLSAVLGLSPLGISETDQKSEMEVAAQPEEVESNRKTEVDTALDRDKLWDKMVEIIVGQLAVDPEQVIPEAAFADNLGADSLDAVELVMAFEEEFNVEIPDLDVDKISTIKDAYNYGIARLGL